MHFLIKLMNTIDMSQEISKIKVFSIICFLTSHTYLSVASITATTNLADICREKFKNVSTITWTAYISSWSVTAYHVLTRNTTTHQRCSPPNHLGEVSVLIRVREYIIVIIVLNLWIPRFWTFCSCANVRVFWHE